MTPVFYTLPVHIKNLIKLPLSSTSTQCCASTYVCRIIAWASLASESNTNLAMHLGAMNLKIACLSSPDCKCYVLRLGFWGTIGISSGRRVTVFELPSDTKCHRMNAQLITWQKKHYIRFSELWRVCVVVDFCLDFPVVFMLSIKCYDLT